VGVNGVCWRRQYCRFGHLANAGEVAHWNALLERIMGTESSDLSWWDVVPQMRNLFNLL
jgi:hypothetical protein